MEMIVKDEISIIRAELLRAQTSINVALAKLDSIAIEPPKPLLIPPKIEIVKPPVKIATEEPLVMTDEWKQTLDLLHRGTGHVFVTGGAGTGKSTLLQHFIATCRAEAAVVCPTGVAALRVGGQTLHSFFGFGIGELEIKRVSDSRKAKYENLDMLIIDEISMVRADVMDAADQFLRMNGRDKTRPFGGCRVVMFGDPFQLPPVSKEAAEKKFLFDQYGTDTPYFFHANVWRDGGLKTCQLTTIFRQKDPAFTNALNAVRSGVISPKDLDLINSRVISAFRPPADGDVWLTLTTTNNAADQANQRMLNTLPGSPETYEAFVTGDFDEKNYPTDQQLRLKVGADVMFIRNNRGAGKNPVDGWVNGTLGRVTSLKPLKVMANGVEHEVDPATWENMVFEYDEKTKKLTRKEKGTFTQIPLKLASAITIHKSQGLSMDRVIVDLANGTFAAGQGYVALSRCRTLEGMVLRKALQERDLIVSTEVQKFLKGEPIARPAIEAAKLF